MSDRYNQPERGRVNWGELMNENFRDIGADIEALESGGGGGGSGNGWPDSTTRSRRIHVDPDGDDSASGTESNPLSTVSEAASRIPAYVGDVQIIDVADGTYDEDVVLGPFTAYVNVGEPVQLEGNRSDPEAVRIGSITALGAVGVSTPTVKGVAPMRDATSITDSGALRIFGGGAEGKFEDIAFAPESGEIDVGFAAYGGARADVRDVNIDGCVQGFESKRGSHIGARGVSGHASQYAYTASEGGQLNFHSSSATAGGALRYEVYGGKVWSDFERWRTIYDGSFSNESVSVTIPTPSFVYQGVGEMRVKIRLGSDERAGAVDVEMGVTGVSNYNVRTEGPSGVSQTTASTIPLASGIGGSYSSCTLEYTVESARDRVLVVGDGADRRLEADIATRATTVDSPNPGYDDITISTNTAVTSAEIKVEARRIAAEEM